MYGRCSRPARNHTSALATATAATAVASNSAPLAGTCCTTHPNSPDKATFVPFVSVDAAVSAALATSAATDAASAAAAALAAATAVAAAADLCSAETRL